MPAKIILCLFNNIAMSFGCNQISKLEIIGEPLKIFLLGHNFYIELTANINPQTLKLKNEFWPKTMSWYGLSFFSGLGMQWNNLGDTNLAQEELTMATVMTMLVVDIVLYALLTAYFDALFPGEFGVPLPFYFPFTVCWICYPSKPIFSCILCTKCTQKDLNGFE